MESQASGKGRCFHPFAYAQNGSLIFALESSPPIIQLSVPEMVAVAQLVEPLIVIQVVAGSSPVGRPTLLAAGDDQPPCLARYCLT